MNTGVKEVTTKISLLPYEIELIEDYAKKVFEKRKQLKKDLYVWLQEYEEEFIYSAKMISLINNEIDKLIKKNELKKRS